MTNPVFMGLDPVGVNGWKSVLTKRVLKGTFCPTPNKSIGEKALDVPIRVRGANAGAFF